MAKWFYVEADQQHGPVSLEELQRLLCSAGLARDTLVWSAGMKEWLPAGEVPDLAVARGETKRISVNCPNCGATYEADADKHVGTVFECSKCENSFVVRSPDAPRSTAFVWDLGNGSATSG